MAETGKTEITLAALRRNTAEAEARRALGTVRMYLDSIERELSKDGGDEIRVLFEIGQAAEYIGAADRRFAIWHALGELVCAGPAEDDV